jgi:hypothetical protein
MLASLLRLMMMMAADNRLLCDALHSVYSSHTLIRTGAAL